MKKIIYLGSAEKVLGMPDTSCQSAEGLPSKCDGCQGEFGMMGEADSARVVYHCV